MPDDLQPAASTGEQQTAMPEGQPQAEPETPMIPESDLRAFQSQADKRQAELQRLADTAQARADAAGQQLAALQATVDQLARETMEPAEAEAFISQQQQAAQYQQTERDAILWRRQQYAQSLAEQYEIPIAEFNAVINDPNATQQDALKVVTDHLKAKAGELGKVQDAARAEAEVALAKDERQVRRTEGKDKIGAQAEPAAGSTDLEAAYRKEADELKRQAWARPRVRDWSRALIDLKAKYRELGLDI